MTDADDAAMSDIESVADSGCFGSGVTGGACMSDFEDAGGLGSADGTMAHDAAVSDFEEVGHSGSAELNVHIPFVHERRGQGERARRCWAGRRAAARLCL